jgi:hypothetical protein
MDTLPVPRRDDAAESGRRRDATLDLLLKHPNTTVITYV